MSLSDQDTPFAPAPIHRAIDQAMILSLELRAIEQRALTGEPIDVMRLTQMFEALAQLTDLLVTIRDQAT